MNKFELQSSVKSTGTAYVLFLLLGAQYAYLNKWGLQILYWITLGGVGIWSLIILFTLPTMVRKHNKPIFEELERKEKERDYRMSEKS